MTTADQPTTSNPPALSADCAVVTGGSAGLGKAIAEALLRHGYGVVLVGRDGRRLQQATDALVAATGCPRGRVSSVAADVTDPSQVTRVHERVVAAGGTLKVLVNVVGQSDRGRASELTADRLDQLIRQNVTGALLCTTTLLPLLKQSSGHVINIGSLAGKLTPRYLGGYAVAKHALTAWTGQLRSELRESGVHVGLVSPGPIARPDANRRYDDLIGDDLPPSAAAPGGGAKLKGLSEQVVAAAVIRCIEKRQSEVILPRRVRALVILSALSPRLGEWLLSKFTSSS